MKWPDLTLCSEDWALLVLYWGSEPLNCRLMPVHLGNWWKSMANPFRQVDDHLIADPCKSIKEDQWKWLGIPSRKMDEKDHDLITSSFYEPYWNWTSDLKIGRPLLLLLSYWPMLLPLIQFNYLYPAWWRTIQKFDALVPATCAWCTAGSVMCCWSQLQHLPARQYFHSFACLAPVKRWGDWSTNSPFTYMSLCSWRPSPPPSLSHTLWVWGTSRKVEVPITKEPPNRPAFVPY